MSDQEKLFTQDDFDREIKARLARQSKKHEDDTEALNAELGGLRKEKEDRLKADTAAALAEIEQVKLLVDPAVLDLLPTELTAPAQLAWLRKAAGQLPVQEKARTPKTPIAKVGEKEFVPLEPSRRLA